MYEPRREINLFRLVTVSKAVAHRPFMYDLVPVPELLLKLVLFKMDDKGDEEVHFSVKTNPL